MSINEVERTILLALACEEQKNEPADQTKHSVQPTQLFLQRYIELLPVSIKTAQLAARELGLSDVVSPILQAALSFFLVDSEMSAKAGLIALLDRAYLGHRLLEELNDHVHIRTQAYLIHTDMTEANLTAHSLIGEPYANELDSIVSQTLAALNETMHSPTSRRNALAANQALQPFALDGQSMFKIRY